MSQQSKGTKKAPRRERQALDVDRKERELSETIFGGLSGTPLGSKGVDDEKFLGLVSTRSKRTFTGSDKDVENPKDLSAAWEDEDDSSFVVAANSSNRVKKLRDSREATNWHTHEFENRLRRRYEETSTKTSRAEWADVDRVNGCKELGVLHTDDSDADALASGSSGMFSRTARGLPPHAIEIIRLKDANANDPSGAVLRTVSFHPESDPDAPLLMTAGLDKSMRFYSVGKDDETRKIHGIHCT